MNYTDKVTIAIPCYERKDFFKEAIDSALNQTVKCKIIAVDNNSSHRYFEEVCREKGISYYRNETNIGLYPNIGRCFELSETEYVKILDDDDILSPVYIESFLKAIEKYPDTDIFFSNYDELISGKEESHDYIMPFGYLGPGKKIIEYGIKYDLSFPFMSSTIRKTKIFKKSNLKSIEGGFDWEWIYSLADTLIFYGDASKLYKFRIHGNQAHNRDWIIHIITTSYIYDTILYKKINSSKQKRSVKRKVLFNLLYIKANITENELTYFLSDETKYSEYLKFKLKSNSLIRLIFHMPKSIAQLLFTGLKFRNWIVRKLNPEYKIN